jgi:hypothetical protein
LVSDFTIGNGNLCIKRWEIMMKMLNPFEDNFPGMKETKIEVITMGDWNEQSAPNNNLLPKTLRTGKFVGKQTNHEFSEELADGGERDQYIERQKNDLKMK